MDGGRLKITNFGLLLSASLILGISNAVADTLTDPQVYIGNGFGHSCASGCAGSPNFIGGTLLDMYIPGTSGSNAPMLLILGIPNYSGVAPTMGEVDALNSTGMVLASTNFALGVPTFTAGAGGSDSGLVVSGARGWNSTTGLVGATGTAPYTPTASLDVYNFIGVVPPTDSSENTSNWFGSTEAGVFGSTPSSFGLYVYAINYGLPGQNYFNISFSGSGLPKGTIAIGYALSSAHTFSTPWTVAGEVVPEPGTLALFGTGLTALAGLIRRLHIRNK